MSNKICPVSKWQNTIPTTMIFLPPPSPPNSSSKKKRQRQGRNGKCGGGVAGRKSWVKGRKRKDQELVVNVCKIHIFWWAQNLVLFAIFLRVKISDNQVIPNTSLLVCLSSHPPKCGFCPCLFSYIAVTRLAKFSSIPLGFLHWIYPQACQKAVRESGQRWLNLFIYFSGK